MILKTKMEDSLTINYSAGFKVKLHFSIKQEWDIFGSPSLTVRNRYGRIDRGIVR